jgi:hypothetical protein
MPADIRCINAPKGGFFHSRNTARNTGENKKRPEFPGTGIQVSLSRHLGLLLRREKKCKKSEIKLSGD